MIHCPTLDIVAQEVKKLHPLEKPMTRTRVCQHSVISEAKFRLASERFAVLLNYLSAWSSAGK